MLHHVLDREPVPFQAPRSLSEAPKWSMPTTLPWPFDVLPPESLEVPASTNKRGMPEGKRTLGIRLPGRQRPPCRESKPRERPRRGSLVQWLLQGQLDLGACCGKNDVGPALGRF